MTLRVQCGRQFGNKNLWNILCIVQNIIVWLLGQKSGAGWRTNALNGKISPGIHELFAAHVNQQTIMSEEIDPYRIRLRTLATMNTHQKALHNARFSVSDEEVPYFTIRELFAARRMNVSCWFFRSALERGIMFTSAPVSIRKHNLDLLYICDVK